MHANNLRPFQQGNKAKAELWAGVKRKCPIDIMSFGEGLEWRRQTKHVQPPKWLHVLWTKLLTSTRGLKGLFSSTRNGWANWAFYSAILFRRDTRVTLAPVSTQEQKWWHLGRGDVILSMLLDNAANPVPGIQTTAIAALVEYKLTLPAEAVSEKLKG